VQQLDPPDLGRGEDSRRVHDLDLAAGERKRLHVRTRTVSGI
jgi:hypothetical protein